MPTGSKRPGENVGHMDIACHPTREMRPRPVDSLGIRELKSTVHQSDECGVLIPSIRVRLGRRATQQPLFANISSHFSILVKSVSSLIGGASAKAFAATGSCNAQDTRSTTGSSAPLGILLISLIAIRERAWTGSFRIRAHSISVSPQQPVIVTLAVENRLDILREPSVPCPPFAVGTAVVIRESVGRSEPHTLRTLCREGVDHVAHDGIAHAVADEYDSKFAEQLGDKARRPLLRQIGAPKSAAVNTRLDPSSSGTMRHASARGSTSCAVWNREFGSRVDELLLQSGVSEPIVEIRRYQTDPPFAP